jgi:DNA-directed RNA polymerase subunit RPC12/RpoP
MARIGETKCWNPSCSCADAAVDKTSNSALAIKCHKCGVQIFGKPGTKIHRDIEKATKLDADDAPAAPAAKPAKAAPAPSPSPCPAPRSSGLLIG